MSAEQTGRDLKTGQHKGRKTKGETLTRSENMSRIRAKDTLPELAVRRALWSAGLRYRLHDRRLPGNPDLVFARQRTVIFVHGCFWHCHEGCSNFRLPKTRTEWWSEKLTRNKVRDEEVRNKLIAAGWHVVVIWECEVSDQNKLAALIEQLNSYPRHSNQQ